MYDCDSEEDRMVMAMAATTPLIGYQRRGCTPGSPRGTPSSPRGYQHKSDPMSAQP